MRADISLRESYIETNGIRLHVVAAGPENGDLVILLHGFPEFWRGWIKQIGPLAEAGYRVLMPDQRGYNLSDKPKNVNDYDIDCLAKDVIGLIDAAGRRKAYLVGHDWGAAVAWHTAMQYPDRLEKLVILNVPHPDIMQRFLLSRYHQIKKSWYMFVFQIPWLPETSMRRNDFSGGIHALKRSGKPSTFSEDDLNQYKIAWSQPGALTGMINWYRAAFRRGLRGGANPDKLTGRPVPVPTLMLWGKQDVALSFEMVQPSINLCEAGRLVVFEDATHWVQHDCAAEVNREILVFFGQDRQVQEQS
ncbi:MAG: alpha/beta hydrolase [Chloroflexi bacterium]|nr:alpha/beta hydrolase [Chloroflexota bacterium]